MLSLSLSLLIQWRRFKGSRALVRQRHGDADDDGVDDDGVDGDGGANRRLTRGRVAAAGGDEDMPLLSVSSSSPPAVDDDDDDQANDGKDKVHQARSWSGR